MASADFFTGFTYKWAQTGNVFDWQDDQYKLGWATIGSTPPSVEQFNRVFQIADEKSNWLYGQLKTVADAKSVTLSAGSLTGLQQVIAAYGQSSVVDSTAGRWLRVGAFGWGELLPTHTTYGFPADFDQMDTKTCLVGISGNFTNGPLGAGSTAYAGASLEVICRGTTTGAGVVQRLSIYATGTSPKFFARIGGGAFGARTWSAWETIYTSSSIPAATTAVAGISRLATTAEAQAGSLATVAVTPAGLAAAVPAATTATAGKARMATVAETAAGASSSISVTPAGLAPLTTGRLLNTVIINTPGVSTYTPTPGTNFIIVEGVGGGGAGGGTQATGAGYAAASTGGGGGGYFRKRITSGFSGVTVTVGAGGTPATGAGGGNGGATSFGALCSASGGGGGAYIPALNNFPFFVGSTGVGVGTGGDINGNGGWAEQSIVTGFSSFLQNVGASGGSYFGGGVRVNTDTAAANAVTPGTGGSGVARSQSLNALPGGAGAPGMVKIWEYS